MFFKRLSRSRNNSYTADDESFERVPALASGENPPSSYRASGQFPNSSPPSTAQDSNNSQNNNTANRMYGTTRSQEPSANYGSQRPSGGLGTRDSGYVDAAPTSPATAKTQDHSFSAPDLLTRAFNEAVRPYSEKIEHLEQQLAEMQGFIEQLEQQRMDVFSWIDKRGLRPDVPAAIAKQMDSSPDAATSLNAQLDRKITIVNFDLHRLQDDLNDSISSSHFASAMTKFLPDIQRLADLPAGPRYAYELLIKLVGNLNSHGGLEASGAANGAGDDEIEEDRRARGTFYERMDSELVEVVKRRQEEREEWSVGREIKRLEKNAAYLKNLGIEPYFPRSLDVMRQQEQYGSGQATPPRYQ